MSGFEKGYACVSRMVEESMQQERMRSSEDIVWITEGRNIPLMSLFRNLILKEMNTR